MTLGPSPVRKNALYSILDYVSQPAIMILAAPFLLKALGIQQYGTWMLVNSIAATATGLGGGFGDGATRYISLYRGSNNRSGAVRSLLAVLVINCVLGVLSGVAMIVTAPWLIAHVFLVEASLRGAGIVALRISAVILMFRFAESVFASAVRGCERYQPVVILSVAGRSLVTLLALVLTMNGFGLEAILWATLAVAVASLAGHAYVANVVLDIADIWNEVDVATGVREVFSFGSLTWLKSTLGVLIGYADRLLVAAFLGTGALAIYSLCNQLTQPIHAIIASGFSFIFPNLSASSAAGRWTETQSRYRVAAVVATSIVAAICLPMILGAHIILRLWLGGTYAQQDHGLLIAMVLGNGLLAISVVPHYAALALGRSRALVVVNLVSGALSSGACYLLIRRVGLLGGGLAKIIAGLAFLSIFMVVHSAFQDAASIPEESPAPTPSSSRLDFAKL